MTTFNRFTTLCNDETNNDVTEQNKQNDAL